ncbi:putative lectin [Acanthamoeba castellanii mimivirus]|uniref:Putative lectin L633 n=6 Tax=Mimivirus TaxID=315393 RepID=YL633_MIMIV|nr:putative lectin [Acanthamoeba polyphaga mimivirus]Q5UR81.1 RecName: Full=Putative lectin L633; Flags: Precursor [Acanthamoeba polyphaga mimivirus]ALR84221.1 putative lectin [Niemeyer virus]BAV61749.1 putative lectin [Acanthamoeba castellanii mimivirus]AAV50894.1 unknown [Acanthamoeba polyphaga mimivirus]ADO18312.1 putative lectin [Acanthamoeba polyphaga mimivirus]AEJ34880.1 hypothetical protein MIMI_L633 [Acanthamoeba polyphaga mimivirus]
MNILLLLMLLTSIILLVILIFLAYNEIMEKPTSSCITPAPESQSISPDQTTQLQTTTPVTSTPSNPTPTTIIPNLPPTLNPLSEIVSNGDNVLQQQQSLINGDFAASIQLDGNLCISNTKNQSVLWCSNSAELGQAPYFLLLRSDGNMCIQDSHNNPTWCSGVIGGQSPWKATLQSDGDLCINDYLGQELWCATRKLPN